jgi:hypothetical protein
MHSKGLRSIVRAHLPVTAGTMAPPRNRRTQRRKMIAGREVSTSPSGIDYDSSSTD